MPRTQDSIAIFGSGGAVLCNASPDISRQLEATADLWPRKGRHTPISAVVLVNGDLDHVLGLFSLREAQPLAIYATEPVCSGLREHNAICRTLERFPGQTTWRALELGRDTEILGAGGERTGIVVRAFASPGKLPLHLSGLATHVPEDNIGLRIADDVSGKVLVYAPNAAYVEPAHLEADTLLFDGTFWSSDELMTAGASTIRAEAMGHIPIGGPEGSLALVKPRPGTRAIYTHINNTNPVLAQHSPPRRHVEAAGWEIAYDGMEIDL